MLYAERFELVEHIAKCTTNPGVTSATYRSQADCSYTDGNIALFATTGVKGCTNDYYNPNLMTWQEYLDSLKPENGGGCYNAFSDGNAFAS